MNWVRVKLYHLQCWWRGELGPERSVGDIIKSRDGLVRPWPVGILYDACFILKKFWSKEWKWIIGTLLGIAGLVLAYLRLGK